MLMLSKLDYSVEVSFGWIHWFSGIQPPVHVELDQIPDPVTEPYLSMALALTLTHSCGLSSHHAGHVHGYARFGQVNINRRSTSCFISRSYQCRSNVIAIPNGLSCGPSHSCTTHAHTIGIPCWSFFILEPIQFFP